MKNAAIITAAVLATALSIVAQEEQPSQQNPSQQQPASSEKSQQELKVSDQEAKRQITDANKASKLIGMQVKNKEGEDLGKIKELVVDLESGKVGYAVLSVGGAFGIGGKLVAIPVQALTLKPGDKALLIDLQKQQLAQARGFNEDRWPDLNAAEKGQTIGLSSGGSAQGRTSSESQSQQSSESNKNQQQNQQKEQE